MIKKIKIIVGVFVLATVISYFVIQLNEKQFDAVSWHTNPLSRYKMSKDIKESNVLIGKSKDAVVELLGKGEPSTLTGRDHLVYSLGKPPSFFETKKETLVVIFEHDYVIQVLHLEE
ncbi:hypothetical protein Q4512_01225 [Oceanihabitans sp. 2_MG-2023]|uniref:hypothetical protein n=1 Tax=Oceanihabitans sp. 2_MG-2023 TaxID=3062661 RepID=UPI0026E1E9A3|nr:hypothetical protein [Oceanihabitans sp. 2_MG-2023]MDO6595512.1 hypothetical protein [Oceanihabitans sp. 2_MG-2023]